MPLDVLERTRVTIEKVESLFRLRRALHGARRMEPNRKLKPSRPRGAAQGIF